MGPVQRTLTQKTKTKTKLNLGVTGNSLVSYVIIAVTHSANHYEIVVDLSDETKSSWCIAKRMFVILTYHTQV